MDILDWIAGGMETREFFKWTPRARWYAVVETAPGNWGQCRTCNTVAERQVDEATREAYYEFNPGCRAQYDLTEGLEYSPGLGAFIGYQAPGVAPIEDAVPIEDLPVPAVLAAPPPPPPVAAEPMPAIDCAAGECPWDGSGPAPVAAVAPFPEGDIDAGPLFGEVPAIVLADPALAEGLEVGVSISWGTIVAVILILLGAYWFFNR